ncbi:MAG TPA: patatin-like phospholipase family protein [Polyangiaceae bacterium]|nr:patatin-like phospholipase family protein [Polyangiaceae bacterium]
MKPKIALCLPGGGVTGAMYQIGALAALEDVVQGFQANDLGLYVGTSSGASVAAALAGGIPVQRMYRALLDPADVFFPLERRDLLRVDLGEWARALGTIFGAVRHGGESVLKRKPSPSPQALWEQLDRLYDSLPTGVFKLEGYERFLEDFFARRGVPNNFRAMPHPLLIMAHDLDSGAPVFFGSEGSDHVPVSRACIASTALPPFFSPVRIRDRFYIDAMAAQVAHVDAAVDAGSDVLIVVNPMVPVRAEQVPTGHGHRPSVRDKGYLWVANQAIRIGMHTLLREALTRIRTEKRADVILIEPDPTDGILFMFSPASFTGRRKMLEYAYRATRDRMLALLASGDDTVARAGFSGRTVSLAP